MTTPTTPTTGGTGGTGALHPPPPAPSILTVLRAEYLLLLRNTVTRGRLIGIGLLALLSLFSGIVVAASSLTDPLDSAVGFLDGNLSTFIPVGVLVIAAATLGDLIDDGSLVYLWLRPIPHWVHVVAAWAATVTITLPLVGIPVLAATMLIHPDPTLFGATTLGVLVAIAGYGGLFVTIGVRFRRSLPWGLIYILIWEGFVASAGETASRLALRSYIRSILAQTTGIELKLADFTLTSGVLVPLAAGALALAYAARRLATTDHD